MRLRRILQGFFIGILLLSAKPCFSKTKTSPPKDKKAAVETPEEREERLRGGYAALLEVSIPHPIELGFGWMQPKGESHFGAFGLLQKDLAPGRGVRDIKLSMQHIEYRYRSEPWQRHPLFWQISGGYQQIQIDGTRAVKVSQNDITFSTDIQGKLTVRSLYYIPKVGIIKHFRNGLSLSWGFGYMIPALVSSKFESKVPGDPLLDELLQQLGSYKATQRDLEHVGKRIGQVGLPHMDLIELIWRI